MKRREFLEIVSLAAGASTLTNETAAAASPVHRDLRKAIMYQTISLSGTVLEKFQAVKAAGFVGVEPMSHMNQSEVLDALGSTGLQAASVCCSTHWKNPVTDPRQAVREA